MQHFSSTLFQEIFHWKKSDPVAYQKWYVRNKSLITVCYTMKAEENAVHGISSFQCRGSTKKYFAIIQSTSPYEMSSNAHPTSGVQDNCTALLLFNPSDPQWLSVNCKDSLAKSVYCAVEKKGNTISPQINISAGQMFCPQNTAVRVDGGCLNFEWGSVRKLSKRKDSCLEVESVLKMVNQPLPALFSCDFKQVVTSRTNKYEVQYYATDFRHCDIEAYAVERTNMKPVKEMDHLFDCGSGHFVSVLVLCDGFHDCTVSKADEEQCHCSGTLLQSSRKCKFNRLNGAIKCSEFYWMKGGKCQKYMEIVKNTKENIIDVHMPGRAVPTLASHSSDILSRDKCAELGKIQCQDESQSCYSLSDICLYKLNPVGKIASCWAGYHLANCKTFICNGRFRCPGYYCISWGSVCNGVWDCPHGFDEHVEHQCRENRSCQFLFQCTGQMKCIHLLEVCNGKNDCTMGDDEQLCILKNVSCPNNCECLTFVINCQNTSKLPLVPMPYHIVTVSHDMSATILLQKNFLFFPGAVSFSITHTTMETICHMHLLPRMLRFLDASFNKLFLLKEKCFKSAQKLQIIKLNDNNISYIDKGAFLSLKSLKLLNVSRNEYLALREPFLGLSEIQAFAFIQIMPQNTKSHFFNQLSIQVVQTDHFYTTCTLKSETIRIVPDTVPWHSVCSNILPSVGMKATIFPVIVLTIISNSISFLLQQYLSHSDIEGAFTFLLAARNAADVLGVGPFVIVAVADQAITDQIQIDLHWISHFFCFLAMWLFTAHSLITPLFICLSSYSRLNVVAKPLTSKYKRKSFIQNHLLFIIVPVILVVTLFCFVQKFVYVLVPTPFCCPYVDPSDSYPLTTAATVLVFAEQVTALVCIILFYTKLVIQLKESEQNIKQSVSKERNYNSTIFQLVSLSIFYTVSWLPSGLIFLVTLFLGQYPLHLPAWATLVFFPLNAFFCPMVFFCTNVKKLTAK